MKIFIPSRGRAQRIQTHRLFDGANYCVVLHNYSEAFAYEKNVTIPHDRLYVSNELYNLGAQRDHIHENLVDKGEWYLQIDDNVRNIYVLAEPWFSIPALNHDEKNFDNVIWRRRFRHALSWPLLNVYLQALIQEAEKRGAWLVGFANNESPMYRDTKYRDFGFVNGKMMLIRKGRAKWDRRLTVKSDYGFTVANLQEYGRVLITDYIYPDGEQGQKGGQGPLDARAPKNIAAACLLMKENPGLFRFKNRPGRAEGSEIVFAMNSLERFEAWKKGLSLSI